MTDEFPKDCEYYEMELSVELVDPSLDTVNRLIHKIQDHLIELIEMRTRIKHARYCRPPEPLYKLED